MRLTIYEQSKHKVNTTKINRKRSPDTGIEPETSNMPGGRANLHTTRTSMFSHALSYYKYTQVNTMMYDLRCNAGGARPVKIRYG